MIESWEADSPVCSTSHTDTPVCSTAHTGHTRVQYCSHADTPACSVAAGMCPVKTVSEKLHFTQLREDSQCICRVTEYIPKIAL